jgi:DNA-binding transcriptional ArsR family regulator
MKIYENMEGNLKIEFIYSPLFEMLCSLHVLTNPEHHMERVKWARKLKGVMDSRLYDEIMYFGRNFSEYLTVMDFERHTEAFNDLNVMTAIEAISEIKADDFLYVMLREDISKEDIRSSIARKSPGKLNITKEQGSVFMDPEGFRRRLISCLKEYYYLHFEKELRYIEPVLIRALKRHVEQYGSLGLYGYVDTLHNRIEVSDDAFYFHKYTKLEMPFKDLRSIVFTPGSFIDPHLLIGRYGKDTLHLHIRVHLAETLQDVPLDLLNIMKALGDDTRLKIIKMIYKKASSTQSLSRELGLTEACISKHLKALHEAEILYKERQGNYIYYRLNTMVLDRIPMDIYQYLDGNIAQRVV